jgi:tetratricopeptide (TPR) repeat protein
MAPEQVRGGIVDARTDVFALGVLLYEMLTGSRPFLGATVAEVTHNILYGRLQPPTVRGAPLPEPLQEVLARALASDPAERYQSAGALAGDLRAVAARGAELEAALTKAMPLDRWAELTRQDEPRQGPHALRTLAIAVLPALLLLLAALLYLRLQGGDESAAPVDEQARRVSYVRLLAEGKRLLAAGDPGGAAVLFETAAGIVQDPTAARELREEAERRMADDEARIRLEGARADLRAGRYDEALATAREMLEAEQGREKALEVLAEVQTALASSPVTRRRPPPPATAAPAFTPPPRLAPLSPVPVPLPTPSRSHRSTLVVTLRSAVPEGVLTVWARDREIVREPFAFYRRDGLRRRPAVPGRWSRELVLSPGSLPLRVLVARSGQQAKVRELHADLEPGGRTVLMVSVPAEGAPVVELHDSP